MYCGYSNSPSSECDSSRQASLLLSTPGNKTNDGVQHDQRGDLTTGQHKVADGDLFGASRQTHAFVDALVSPTHQDEVPGRGHLVSQRLVEAPASGRQQDQPRSGPPHRLDGLDQRPRAHDHPWPPTVRVVVHAAVAVSRELTHVHDVHPRQSGCQGAAGNAVAQRPGEHVWKDRQDVGVQAHPPNRSNSASSIPKWWATS